MFVLLLLPVTSPISPIRAASGYEGSFYEVSTVPGSIHIYLYFESGFGRVEAGAESSAGKKMRINVVLRQNSSS